ncbi:hypothetical protein PALB_30740 [Pseudoalteromonas luteoviolacea B = ATCC 29581]|nr:hypothetical protein PALB_30740 [Pseudoalteromonas luteoviolacea B = ATCC 29581]
MAPMVRRAEAHCVCFQLVLSRLCEVEFHFEQCLSETQVEVLQLGSHCFLYFAKVNATDVPFPTDQLIQYSLLIDGVSADLTSLSYNQILPSLCIPLKLTQVFHGSCRNPHHESRDSLSSADSFIKSCREHGDLGPQILLMSGDQIYADDVAGPMLLAIAQLTECLGLFDDAEANLALPMDLQEQLYRRHLFLPKTPWQSRSKLAIGYWLKKDQPHFTSMKAGNHLIALKEFIALYLLSWSPDVWQLIDQTKLTYSGSNLKHASHFNHELTHLKQFIDDLSSTKRLFGNISTLMMFDDHDVTDDWNLTANWEETVYKEPQSLRIILNGMTAYWLFQGLGNDGLAESRELIQPFKKALKEKVWHWKTFAKPIHRFNSWHYCLATEPKLVVLDTRTHRWRNDEDFNEPSGLMDWDRLLELESNLISHEHVLLVSPAPVFGVKAIEAIQAVFNACGEPLLVDVENWMAHEGAAKKLLDIFRRADTPSETIILSGDVHYSFCFSVKARFGKHDNRIWQLTASGIKNEFPKKLIKLLDKLDTWLYSPLSPLNLFTKRWKMSVDKHSLTDSQSNQFLISSSSISLVTMREGRLEKYELIHGSGQISRFDLDD